MLATATRFIADNGVSHIWENHHRVMMGSFAAYAWYCFVAAWRTEGLFSMLTLYVIIALGIGFFVARELVAAAEARLLQPALDKAGVKAPSAAAAGGGGGGSMLSALMGGMGGGGGGGGNPLAAMMGGMGGGGADGNPFAAMMGGGAPASPLTSVDRSKETPRLD